MGPYGSQGPGTGLRDQGSRDLGLWDLGLQDLGLLDLGLRDLGSRDLGSRDLGLRDLGLQDLGSRDLGSRDPSLPNWVYFAPVNELSSIFVQQAPVFWDFVANWVQKNANALTSTEFIWYKLSLFCKKLSSFRHELSSVFGRNWVYFARIELIW